MGEDRIEDRGLGEAAMRGRKGRLSTRFQVAILRTLQLTTVTVHHLCSKGQPLAQSPAAIPHCFASSPVFRYTTRLENYPIHTSPHGGKGP